MLEFEGSGSEMSPSEHLKYHDGTDRTCPVCQAATQETLDAAQEHMLLHSEEDFNTPHLRMLRDQLEVENAVEDFLAVEQLVREVSRSL